MSMVNLKEFSLCWLWELQRITHSFSLLDIVKSFIIMNLDLMPCVLPIKVYGSQFLPLVPQLRSR